MNFEQLNNQAEKSPEQLRYDEILKDSQERSFKVNGFDVDDEDPQGYEKARERSMWGYLNSADPEKVAMFKLREARLALQSYNLGLHSSEKQPDYYEGMSKMEKIKSKISRDRHGWVDSIKESTLEAKSKLANIGLELPSTPEELNSTKVREMIDNMESYGNWQRLANEYKSMPEDDWQKMVADEKVKWEKED